MGRALEVIAVHFTYLTTAFFVNEQKVTKKSTLGSPAGLGTVISLITRKRYSYDKLPRGRTWNRMPSTSLTNTMKTKKKHSCGQTWATKELATVPLDIRANSRVELEKRRKM
jgi:hypothetical protein